MKKLLHMLYYLIKIFLINYSVGTTDEIVRNWPTDTNWINPIIRRDRNLNKETRDFDGCPYTLTNNTPITLTGQQLQKMVISWVQKRVKVKLEGTDSVSFLRLYRKILKKEPNSGEIPETWKRKKSSGLETGEGRWTSRRLRTGDCTERSRGFFGFDDQLKKL